MQYISESECTFLTQQITCFVFGYIADVIHTEAGLVAQIPHHLIQMSSLFRVVIHGHWHLQHLGFVFFQVGLHKDGLISGNNDGFRLFFNLFHLPENER